MSIRRVICRVRVALLGLSFLSAASLDLAYLRIRPNPTPPLQHPRFEGVAARVLRREPAVVLEASSLMHAPSDASSLSEVYHANRQGDGESTDGDEDAAMAPGRVLRVRTRPPRSKVSMQSPFFGPEAPPLGRYSCPTSSCHCLLRNQVQELFV
jgi:hypothetical protein